MHDREVGWFLTLETTAGVDANLLIDVGNACSVAHQTAGFGELTRKIDGRNCVLRCHCNKMLTAGKEEGGTGDPKGTRPLFYNVSQCRAAPAFSSGGPAIRPLARESPPPPPPFCFPFLTTQTTD